LTLNKALQFSIKLIITLAALSYIVIRVIKFEDLEQSWALLQAQLHTKAIGWFFLCLFLMPVVWIIETVKWNFLINKIYPISFLTGLKAILTGLTMALFTPNRIGEVVSRVFVLPQSYRGQAIGLSGFNSLTQMIPSLLIGMLGAGLLFAQQDFANLGNLGIQNSGWIFGGIVSFTLTFLFFKPGLIMVLIKPFKRLSTITKYLEVLNDLSGHEKVIVLGWSTLKYLIYVSQLSLLMILFDVDLSIFQILIANTTIYLILNFIPMISIGELGVRGSVSLLVFGLITDADLAVLIASMFLWILNIAVPAVIGAILLVKIKF